MRNWFILWSALILASCLVVAQQPPPSDYGLGNTHLSPNSSVQNDQSFSPDINQAITNTRGATTQPQSGSPYFAGSSLSAQTALANGPGASSQTAVSTDERAAYAATGASAQNGMGQPAAQNRKGNATNPARRKGSESGTAQRVTSSVPLNQGVSTTSTPGPSTAVPRDPVKARQQMPGAQAAKTNTQTAQTASRPPRP